LNAVASNAGVANAATDFSIKRFVENICFRFGPRLPGTAAEAKTARFLAQALREYCDEVVIDEHRFSPRSFDWGATFHLMIYLVALVAYVIVPPMSLALVLLSISIFFLSRLKGYEILEQFFPQEKTQNVVGKIKSRGQPRQVLILSAHHDSAYYMPFLEKRSRKIFLPVFFFILLAHGILFIAAGVRMVASPFPVFGSLSGYLYGIAVVAGILFFIFRLFLFKNVAVLGANDNLASVGVLVAAARYCAANRPGHIECWFVSFGAEEVGLRGSKRFTRKHWHELEKSMVINLEMVGAGTLMVVAGERMAGARHSPVVVSLIVDAAKACGIEMSTFVGIFGETDASSFSRMGIQAATIAAFGEDGVPPNWHLLTDTPENIDEDHLQNALRVCLKCIHLLDHPEEHSAAGAGSSEESKLMVRNE